MTAAIVVMLLVLNSQLLVASWICYSGAAGKEEGDRKAQAAKPAEGGSRAAAPAESGGKEGEEDEGPDHAGAGGAKKPPCAAPAAGRHVTVVGAAEGLA